VGGRELVPKAHALFWRRGEGPASGCRRLGIVGILLVAPIVIAIIYLHEARLNNDDPANGRLRAGERA
jgi:hypothetical protein